MRPRAKKPTAVMAGLTAAALAAAVLAGHQSASAEEPGRPPGADCYADTSELTVEEQRLHAALPGTQEPAARRFVEAAGFDDIVDRFALRLCEVSSLDLGTQAARQFGADLWRLAVDRGQGRADIGAIDRYDDRPLYWARLYMTRALREWRPDFALSRLQRLALVRILSYASRGIDSVDYPAPGAAERLLVSGFDTFSLDVSLRHSNPSGAAALQLDGRTVTTEQGTFAVEAVMLPVNWSDFDQGIVEDAFGPWLRPGGRLTNADLIMTISQGRRGRMDIEQWAGGFRGGFPDNNRAIHYGPISAAALWPQPQPSPQWIATTLPYQAMIDGGTQPWPVKLNDGVCEWPAGTYPDPGSVRCQADPSEDSRAASAPGGNYLSNESMYRTNRLRLAAGLHDLPGGHLHISSLVYPEDPGALTGAEFESDRKAIVDQTVDLVAAAGAAVSQPIPTAGRP
jgi:hypothetical protein